MPKNAALNKWKKEKKEKVIDLLDSFLISTYPAPLSESPGQLD